MRITDGVGLDGSQAEALGRIVGPLLEAAVVEHEGFGLPVFEKELAIIRALEGTREMSLRASSVEAGAVEEGGRRDLGHRESAAGFTGR